jgi:hypothetical protein
MRMRNWLGIALLAGSACVAHAQVRISMVYGGGGNSGAIWKRDFVELHNNGTTPVDISGWSIQYASAGGTFGGTSPALTAIPANTILQPGQYFLVAEAAGTGGSQDLPGSLPTGGDVLGTIAMSATSGKVALVNNSTALTGTGCPINTSVVVDFVGYGSANCAEGTATPALTNTTAAVRSTNGCTDTENNANDFSITTGSNNFTPRCTLDAVYFCPGFTDCNNNGIPDAVDISSSTSADCDHNGVPDECQITGNDCNNNGILDACELAGHDCNGNGRLDECELATGALTDADGDGIPDACQGAVVANCAANVTVQPAGIRPGSNGTAFCNVEGVNNGSAQNPPPALASYGGMRWNIPAAVAAFDTQYGAGNWEIARAYLHLVQANAAFTVDGPLDLFYTGNDAQDFSVPTGTTPNANTQFFNFYTDYPDYSFVTTYDFVRGTRPPDGSGTREAYLLYDADGSNNAAQAMIGNKLNADYGELTLLLHPAATSQYPAPDGDPFVAATYAGRTHATYRGPALVLFARQRTVGCDPDFNCDGNADQDDVAWLINAIASGNFFSENCGADKDPDFNADGNADQDDVAALINTIASTVCP